MIMGKTAVYNASTLDHFRNPRNVGELDPPAITVEASNPACGDLLRLSVRMEHGVATEARYLARGCTASIAAGSALTEWLTGKSAAEMAALRPEAIEASLGGLEPESRHAAALAADAVRAVAARLG